MDLEKQLDATVHFFQTNPVVGVAILAVLAFFALTRPKDTFKLVAFCLVCVVAFYFITLFAKTASSGSSQKDRMIHKSRDAIGE